MILISLTPADIDNPQTVVFNYYQTHVQKMLEVSYKKKGMEEFPQHLMYRLSIPDFYKILNFLKSEA